MGSDEAARDALEQQIGKILFSEPYMGKPKSEAFSAALWEIPIGQSIEAAMIWKYADYRYLTTAEWGVLIVTSSYLVWANPGGDERGRIDRSDIMKIRQNYGIMRASFIVHTRQGRLYEFGMMEKNDVRRLCSIFGVK